MSDESKEGPRCCASCGGMIDAEGYALGGEVVEAEQVEGLEPKQTDQYSATMRMQDKSGLAEALKRRRGM